MKATHLVLIVVLVVAVAFVISYLWEPDTYADFDKAAAQPGKEFSIIGTLNRTKPIIYDSKNNPNQFTFFLIDSQGKEKQVVYNNHKPQDFEKSDKVVVVGKMEGDKFMSSSMLLKCPSKYNDAKKPTKFGKKSFEAVKN